MPTQLQLAIDQRRAELERLKQVRIAHSNGTDSLLSLAKALLNKEHFAQDPNQTPKPQHQHQHSSLEEFSPIFSSPEPIHFEPNSHPPFHNVIGEHIETLENSPNDHHTIKRTRTEILNQVPLEHRDNFNKVMSRWGFDPTAPLMDADQSTILADRTNNQNHNHNHNQHELSANMSYSLNASSRAHNTMRLLRELIKEKQTHASDLNRLADLENLQPHQQQQQHHHHHHHQVVHPKERSSVAEFGFISILAYVLSSKLRLAQLRWAFHQLQVNPNLKCSPAKEKEKQSFSEVADSSGITKPPLLNTSVDSVVFPSSMSQNNMSTMKKVAAVVSPFKFNETLKEYYSEAADSVSAEFESDLAKYKVVVNRGKGGVDPEIIESIPAR